MKFTEEEKKLRKAMSREILADLWRGKSVVLKTREAKEMRSSVIRLIILGLACAFAGPYVPERFEVITALAGGGFVCGAAAIVMMALTYELATRWANREASLENADGDLPKPVGGVAHE